MYYFGGAKQNNVYEIVGIKIERKKKQPRNEKEKKTCFIVRI